jgi:hypothetical protein
MLTGVDILMLNTNLLNGTLPSTFALLSDLGESVLNYIMLFNRFTVIPHDF